MTTKEELAKAITSLDKRLIEERDSLEKNVCSVERQCEILDARSKGYGTSLEEIENPQREIRRYNSKVHGMSLAFKAIADVSGLRFNESSFERKYSA